MSSHNGILYHASLFAYASANRSAKITFVSHVVMRVGGLEALITSALRELMSNMATCLPAHLIFIPERGQPTNYWVRVYTYTVLGVWGFYAHLLVWVLISVVRYTYLANGTLGFTARPHAHVCNEWEDGKQEINLEWPYIRNRVLCWTKRPSSSLTW